MSTFADLVQTFRVDPSRIRLVYNGVDQLRFRPQPDVRSEIAPWLGFSDPYILYTGHAGPLKNVTRLIQAFALISSKYPCHRLVLAGVGNNANLQHLTEELKIRDRVVMLDHISHDVLPLLYGGCDVFAFPSLFEGHSLSLLEAMASGCAILTSNFGSMLETVGDAALCVNPYEVQSIAAGLERLLSDCELRQRLGAAARLRVQPYTPEAQAEGTLKVIQEAWELWCARH
jgi:glycosyltransferase involved in cell wall biosynthesis